MTLADISDLTPREREVLETYCLCETHRETAIKLGISVQTLKNHLGAIYRKLGVSKAHAAVYRLPELRVRESA